MYDFIGDTHGEYNLLVKLLVKAGYKKDSDGVYFHPKRIAFFLGDFIDKGNNVFKTFNLIKSMVEKGYAKSILGNHELNFICINTEHKGVYLRERTESKLKQSEKSKTLLKNFEENKKFLLSLPLFYEEDDFRVVHACWHPESINKINKLTNKDNQISFNQLKELYYSKNEDHKALEICLKGIEVDISPNKYKDYIGQERTKARLNWWEDGKLESLPLEYKDIPHNEDFFYTDNKRVFFGHYCKKVKPYIQSPSALCLDFNSKERLCLYRNTNEEISLKNLIIVSK